MPGTLNPVPPVVSMDPITTISTQAALTTFECRAGETGFEGVEKRLELDFRFNPSRPHGPRDLERSFWDEVLAIINAKIMDKKSTETMDSYILSESSLFVSIHRVTLITCGTTLLLNCLGLLQEGCKRLKLEIEWVQYSRKNFTYPWLQPAPHCSLSSEYDLLHKHFPQGHPFILGPLDGDHYFIYQYDNVARPGSEEIDQAFQMYMYDLGKALSEKLSFTETGTNSEQAKEIRKVTGMDKIFEGFPIVQDAQFSPCGYSANAIKGETYVTTHITPESNCSFASMETNELRENYESFVRNVLEVYQPARFSAIVFLDDVSAAGQQRAKGNAIGVENCYQGYVLTNRTLNEFDPGYVTIKADYVWTGASRGPPRSPLMLLKS